jgi:PST family polysaccharide transporter
MIMGGATLAMRPITLLGGIILARLLDPDNFGAVAMAMLFVGSSQIFATLGMRQAYVQSDSDHHQAAFHAFVVTFIAGLLLWGFTVANAEWLATLLGDSEVAPLLRALSFLIIFSAFAEIPTGVLQKQFKFGIIAKVSMFSAITYLVVTISLAFLGFGVWSLVIGNLARSLLGLILTWTTAPGWDWLKPVRWDQSVFRALLRFGLPLTGAGTVSYFYSHWDDWLVGRQLGVTSLGYYSKAYELTNKTIRQFSSNILSEVLFPTLAKIREDKKKLYRAYIKSVQLVSTIMFPVSMGLFATAPLLVSVLVGEKWLPMVPTFQIFALLILTRPVSANSVSIFTAVGRTEYLLQSGLILSAVLVPTALILLPYGIVGVAAAVIIGDAVGMLYNLIRLDKILPGSMKSTFRLSLPPFAAAIIMMFVVLISQTLLLSTIRSDIWALAIIVCIGVIVYFAGILLFQFEFTKEVLITAIQIIDRRGYLTRLRSAIWTT